jgi:hypothetical protein
LTKTTQADVIDHYGDRSRWSACLKEEPVVAAEPTEFSVKAQFGDVTYVVDATRERGDQVVVEIRAADAERVVVVDGILRFGLDHTAAITTLVQQVVAGVTPAKNEKQTRARQPVNAGQPWTPELKDELRQAWLSADPSLTAGALTKELAARMGRTRSSIRSELPRVGCDHDEPGRAIEDIPV